MKLSRTTLLHGDVDAIKEYIFETSSLPQIRGGSQLLIECEDEIRRHIRENRGREIYCGGGSFLFEVPTEQAASLAKEIQRIYLRKTLVVTVTVVHGDDMPPPFHATMLPSEGWAARLVKTARTPDSEFASTVAFLGANLREAKLRKTVVPFFETVPFGGRCETCGRRMAVQEVMRLEPGENKQVEIVKLCPVCVKRHETGRAGGGRRTRGKFNELFQRFVSPKARQAPDLDHLVRSSRRKYLAFLYADGNNIGELLQKVKDQEEYHALSRALKKGTRNALFNTLKKVCEKPLRGESYWPFEIVSVGGDDVTLLIQAGYAWEVAVEFLDRFEEEIQHQVKSKLGYWPEGWPQKVTAACGIVITDVKYPIHYSEQLANDLLRRAKNQAKKDPTGPQSAIDFLWLPNPVITKKVEPLMVYYERQSCELTARPYILSKARQMSILAEKASHWPRTQRHQWAEALERGFYVSSNTIYYNIARRKDPERSRLSLFLEEVGKTLNVSPDIPRQFWQFDQTKQKFCTALLDVLELAELRSMRRDVSENTGGNQ